MEESKHSTVAFLVGYLALFVLIGFLIWPYITAFIFAGILAGSFNPLTRFFLEKLQWGRKRTAIVICTIIIAAIFLPTVFLIQQLSIQAFDLYQHLKTTLTKEFLNDLLLGDSYFPQLLKKGFVMMGLKYNVETLQNIILDAAKNTSNYTLSLVNSLVSNIFHFFLQFTIMMVAIFSLIVEGKAIRQFFLELSPLPNDEEELVIDKFNQMNYVSLVGNGIGGVIQGVLAALGFWWAGIGSVLLWMTAMIILAFIPLVGISIVYIPACIYLFFAGNTISAVVLFIWCTLVSLLVENGFKPKFVGNRVQINSTLVFLSILGGLNVFGVAGIFYGPLIISIFLTFVNLYHKRYTEGYRIG